MATSHDNNSVVISFPAGSDLSAFQYYPVALTTAGLLTTIGSTATAPIGVLQDTPDASGVMGAVTVSGPSKVVAYTGAVVAGVDALGVNTSGIAAVTTTDNQFIIGRALSGQADIGVNSIIEALVNVGRY
jgi:hypothetical protein